MTENDIVQAWLLKGLHDLETAKIITSHLPNYYDMIAFHCQQAIEKTLKAYLVHLDIEFKPVHDLGYLVNLIGTKDDSFDDYFEEIDAISRYAVQIRYPDSIIRLSKNEVDIAIKTAGTIYDLIDGLITPKP